MSDRAREGYPVSVQSPIRRKTCHMAAPGVSFLANNLHGSLLWGKSLSNDFWEVYTVGEICGSAVAVLGAAEPGRQ